MKPAVKAAWVAALRSGRYKKGKGRLRFRTTYCPLGVLCDLAAQEGIGRWERRRDGFHFVSGWGSGKGLPTDRVWEWAGLFHFPLTLTDSRGVSGHLLTQLSDEGMSFEEIADLIEAQL